MNISKLPVIDDLRAFEAVARLGSVRAAADEMSLTHGAVSRRVSKLAHYIGIALLVPDGRGIKLTAEGEKLGIAAGRAFEMLAQTLAEIRAQPTQKAVLLSCERSVAMLWLIPHLSEFQDTNPSIPIHLSVGGGPLDFEREGIALAIRRIDFPLDPKWTVETLFEELMGPVMQPAICNRFLEGDYIALGSKTRPNGWRDWCAQHPSVPPPNEIRLMDHHYLMVVAATNGLGVAMCPKVLALGDIDCGRLTAPMGFTSDGSVYGLVYPTALGLVDGSEIANSWLLRIGTELFEDR